jgi:hypothetical protein
MTLLGQVTANATNTMTTTSNITTIIIDEKRIRYRHCTVQSIMIVMIINKNLTFVSMYLALVDCSVGYHK